MSERDRWQPKIDALLRLAEDKGATDAERETARSKLAQILREHPEAETIRLYEPVRRFTMKDVAFMREHGISAEGSWTGRNLGEAVGLMVAEYERRIAGHKVPRALPGHRQITTDEAHEAIGRQIAKQLDAEIEELERLIGDDPPVSSDN